MSNRRRRDPKDRVFWTEHERQRLIQGALAWQQEHPEDAGLPLLRRAMTVLPAERRRRIIAVSQVPWFEAGLREAAKALHEEHARADAEERSLPSSELEDWKERHLHFMRLEVDHLGQISDKQDTLIEEIRLLVGVVKDQIARNAETERLNTHRFGVLFDYLRDPAKLSLASPPLNDQQEPPKPPPPPEPPSKPSGGGSENNGRPSLTTPNGKIKDTSPGYSQPRIDRGSRKPRIAIVGPDAGQFNLIGKQIGETCSLMHLDRNHLKGDLPMCDWFVLTRHCTHKWWNKALATVGRSRVVRLPTTGISDIVATIEKLAREPQATVR